MSGKCLRDFPLACVGKDEMDDVCLSARSMVGKLEFVERTTFQIS